MKVCAIILIALVACAVAEKPGLFSRMIKSFSDTLKKLTPFSSSSPSPAVIQHYPTPISVPAASRQKSSWISTTTSIATTSSRPVEHPTHALPRTPTETPLQTDWEQLFNRLLVTFGAYINDPIIREDKYLKELIKDFETVIAQMERMSDLVKKIFADNAIKNGGDLIWTIVESIRDAFVKLSMVRGKDIFTRNPKSKELEYIKHNGYGIQFLAETRDSITPHFDNEGRLFFNEVQVVSVVTAYCKKHKNHCKKTLLDRLLSRYNNYNII